MTILVLDDDQVLLDLLRTVLAESGYDAIFATGLEEVPANATAKLVITDLVPLKAYRREAALAWVASLRARFGAPVFVLTAHRAAAAERDRLGANAVITKPFDIDALLARIEKQLGQSENHIRKTP